MALNFPSSPVVGQQYSYSGKTWEWSGNYWKGVSVFVPSGASGQSGLSGISGISGRSGESGISGLQGVSGISGLEGISGISGIVGTSGLSGISGIAGSSGISGLSGVSGLSGDTGNSGISGLQGVSGISGLIPSGYITGGTYSGSTLYLINNSGTPQPITGETGFFGTTFDGNGVAISTGLKGYFSIPYSGTIESWKIISPTSGNCQVDIVRSTTIPTSANTITSNNYINLTTQTINSDDVLTGWNVDFNDGDIFAWNVISATTTYINIVVKVSKK
jgi:hypothetical protein